jgi:integrase
MEQAETKGNLRGETDTMSSVRKRTLPSGEVRWLLDYKDLQGKRRARQFETKREAIDFETRTRADLQGGIHVADAASATVAEAAALWLARCESEGLETSTVLQYRGHVRNHIEPMLGGKKLSQLTVPAVEAFRDDLVNTRSKALSQKIITSLKALLKDAMRRGLVRQNVATQTRVKISSRQKTKIIIPAKDEIRGFLTKSAELWDLTKVQITRQREQRIVAVPWRPLIVTALFTGMRLSELRGLTWEHVSFAVAIIKVRQRADFRGVIGYPKSEAGNRDIPLAPMAVNTLKSWKLACAKTEAGWVFPGKDGTIPTTKNVREQCWIPLLRTLGLTSIKGNEELPKYRFHDLRHVAASLLIEQGMQPKRIQEIMGHSSIKVTYDLYGHLWPAPESDHEAMRQIEARLLS